MPIGKNAIKRVENNGYSKVETSAPDMENSSVIANIDEQVVEKIIAPVEKKTRGRKACNKAETSAKTPSAAKVPTEEKKASPVAKTPVKAKRTYTRKTAPAKPAKKEGVVRVEVGEEMPYYLL